MGDGGGSSELRLMEMGVNGLKKLREVTPSFFVKSGWSHDLREDGGGWWEEWSL